MCFFKLLGGLLDSNLLFWGNLVAEKLKEAHKAKDLAGIDTHMAALNAAWTAASEDMYKATQGGAQPGAESGAGGGNASTASAEDVTDVPFEEVK